MKSGLRSYSLYLILTLFTLVSCQEAEPNEEELYSMVAKAIEGDSDHVLIYNSVYKVDTLYGYFPYSMEYQPLKIKLDSVDTIARLYISKRDSVYNSKYISSRDTLNSSYRNFHRFNDSVRTYVEKGDKIRDLINKGSEAHNKLLRGYYTVFSIWVTNKGDTLSVRDIPLYLKRDFPVENLN
jgi:hypothetical protein